MRIVLHSSSNSRHFQFIQTPIYISNEIDQKSPRFIELQSYHHIFIGTKGFASSIASAGADTTGNLFRKFKDTTSSAFDSTKTKTDHVADSVSDQVQTAWEDTKKTTKNVATKTKQKSNETIKSAEHSANFLGKQRTNVIT